MAAADAGRAALVLLTAPLTEEERGHVRRFFQRRCESVRRLNLKLGAT